MAASKGSEQLIPVDLEDELQERFLTYALSTIISRSLPDVRDGLKPIHRRILYSMGENGLKSSARHVKSAKIIGDVLGKYHPHGDSSTYEAMVRLAQDFSMRYPLIDGKGNFGSVDGDSAAAYRYTEAKLTPVTDLFLQEIKQQTVNFRDNYDNTIQEPEVLPVKLPGLLLNGSSGIAVGMACSFPPHNLKEVVAVLLKLIRNPELSTEKIMETLKGPDFPTGGIIITPHTEILNAYRKGHGSVRVRGCWEQEEMKYGKVRIVITALPYGVNKAKLAESIGKLVSLKKLPLISDLRDESTSTMRLVIELKADADADKVMAYLCRHTDLEKNFPLNFTCISDGNRPEQMGIRGIFLSFLRFRKEVIINKLEFELSHLLTRLHILEGFLKIFSDLDRAIALIRASKSRKEAHQKLMDAFSIDEEQSNAILDMRLYTLVGMERETIQKEYDEKAQRVAQIRTLLGSEEKIYALMAEEFKETGKKYGDARRTLFHADKETIAVKDEDFLVHETVTLSLSRKGLVKYVKGRVEPSALRMKQDDSLHLSLTLDTSRLVAFITDRGKVYTSKMYEFPSGSGYGAPIQSLYNFADGESVLQMIPAEAEAYHDEIRENLAASIFAKGKKSETERADLLLLNKQNDEKETISENNDFSSSLFSETKAVTPQLQSERYELSFKKPEVLREKIKTLIEGGSITPTLLLAHSNGKGFRLPFSQLRETTKNGRTLFNLNDDERLTIAEVLYHPYLLLATDAGTLLMIKSEEVSVMNGPASGIILMRTDGEQLQYALPCNFIETLLLQVEGGREKRLSTSSVQLRKRGGKGKRGFFVKKGKRFTLRVDPQPHIPPVTTPEEP